MPGNCSVPLLPPSPPSNYYCNWDKKAPTLGFIFALFFFSLLVGQFCVVFGLVGWLFFCFGVVFFGFVLLFVFSLIRKSSKTLMPEVEFGVVWVAQASLPF